MDRKLVECIAAWMAQERTDEDCIVVRVHFKPDGSIYFAGVTRHHTEPNKETENVKDHGDFVAINSQDIGAFDINYADHYPKGDADEQA